MPRVERTGFRPRLRRTAREGLPPRADVGLAGALALFAVIDLWLLRLTGDFDRHRLALTFSAIAVPATLVWRRRRPLFASVCVAVIIGLQTVVVTNTSTVQLTTVLLLAVSLGIHATVPDGLCGIGSMVAAIVVLSVASGQSGGAGGLLFIPIALGVPWCAGQAVGVARRHAMRLAMVSAELVAEQERSASLVRLEERTRIARELHDTIAHGVSVITLQAAGARQVLAQDPVRASVALTEIERAARAALLDLQRSVAVLRSQSEPADSGPRLIDLLELVVRRRESGQEIELELGSVSAPAALQLAVYRIVQEALTNAAKHAPGAAVRVSVRARDGELELEVVDDGAELATRSQPGGHGLIGIHERVALFGGSLHSGPVLDGGFRLAAHFPLEVVDA